MSKAFKKVASPIASLFKTPDIPQAAVKEPEVMPLADEEALARARKRTAAKKGTGRASTVLSLGAGAGKKTLGG
jgi:hypothetical protein